MSSSRPVSACHLGDWFCCLLQILLLDLVSQAIDLLLLYNYVSNRVLLDSCSATFCLPRTLSRFCSVAPFMPAVSLVPHLLSLSWPYSLAFSFAIPRLYQTIYPFIHSVKMYCTSISCQVSVKKQRPWPYAVYILAGRRDKKKTTINTVSIYFCNILKIDKCW